MNPNRIEGVGAFNNARHFALVNVYGLDQDATSRRCHAGGSRGKRREVADVKVTLQKCGSSAYFGQFKVGFLLQLFNRNLPEAEP